MTTPFHFDVVPLSEVPPSITSIRFNDLEAVPIEDEQVFAGTPVLLQRGAVGFEVRGLMSRHKVWIIQKDGRCQLMRELQHDESEWLGEFASVEAALQAATTIGK